MRTMISYKPFYEPLFKQGKTEYELIFSPRSIQQYTTSVFLLHVRQKRLFYKDDLIKLRYKKHTAISIIQAVKQDLVYNKGIPFYNNRRLGLVPRERVENLIGVNLDEE